MGVPPPPGSFNPPATMTNVEKKFFMFTVFLESYAEVSDRFLTEPQIYCHALLPRYF